MHTHQRFSPIRIALGVVILTAIALGGVTLYQAHSNSALADSALSCTDPAIAHQFNRVPVVDAQGTAARAKIQTGEPAVVATVNGVPITAAQLEDRVQTALEIRSAQLQSEPSDAPAAARSQLEEPEAQVRTDMLNQLIEDELYRQQAKQLGIVISTAQAMQVAKAQVQSFDQMPSSSPARATFVAYLCANRLTPATFAADPAVILGYQEALAAQQINQRVIDSLPASKRNDQTSVQQAISGYLKHLRTSAHVQIFIAQA